MGRWVGGSVSGQSGLGVGSVGSWESDGRVSSDSEGVWLRSCVLGIDIPLPIYFPLKGHLLWQGVKSG